MTAGGKSRFPDDSHTQVLAQLGATLICIQFTEKLLHFCLFYVVQSEGKITADNIEKHRLSKKTMGQLLTSLRRTVGIAENFDSHLSEYLDKRNTLAHDLMRIEGGWSLETDAGRANAAAFLSRTFALDALVRRALTGLIKAWADSAPIPGLPPFPAIAGNEYLNPEMIDRIFFEKE